jgi:hypothetical protein
VNYLNICRNIGPKSPPDPEFQDTECHQQC